MMERALGISFDWTQPRKNNYYYLELYFFRQNQWFVFREFVFEIEIRFFANATGTISLYFKSFLDVRDLK
jgi:hypothetical protein